MKTEFQTHDLTLPAWGPYTKKYSGISHIPPANDGVRFDLAVFPGLYRRRVDVPDVRFESGYHVWAAAPDLGCYTRGMPRAICPFIPIALSWSGRTGSTRISPSRPFRTMCA